MSIDFAKTYDVVIVGGGPVGMGLAIDLGQRGISVAVVEKYPTLHHIPKGQNLTQRTAEHFYFWQCEQELRAAREVPKDYAIGGMTSYDTLLSGYHYDWLQRGLVKPYYFADNERLPQNKTEQVLRDRAAEIACIDIGLGWVAKSVNQDENMATVTIENAQGQQQAVTGQYLVGTDGSNSVVRETAQIPQTKSDHDRQMVLLVFQSTELHELLKRYPDKQFYSVLRQEMQGYWLFFGRVDLGKTWFFHAPVPLGTTKDNFDFKSYLHKAVGAEFDLEIDYTGFWDLRFALADTYRSGRVFIAGDACHSHPPYGGYGINTGLEDARNLGWKLAAKIQGWGSDALLDTYTEERHPVFASTADDFIEKFIIEDRNFLNRYSPQKDRDEFTHAWNTRNEGASEVMAFAPNYDGSSLVFGRAGAKPSARADHAFRARAGHHLAPKKLTRGQDIYEQLACEFTVIALGATDEAVQEFVNAARSLKMPLRIVQDQNPEAVEYYQASLILVRPDQFVAWCGDGGEAPALEILEKAAAIS